jgi:glutathione S-transferase
LLINTTSRFQGKADVDDEISPLLQALDDILNTVESILSKQSFMAGGRFSLVDGFYMPLIHMLSKVGNQKLLLERKHLNHWWETVSERPAWKEAVKPLDSLYGAYF